MIRTLAGALALACLAMLVTSADARPRHDQKQYRFGEPYGRPMSCDTDGRCSGGGSLPEFSSLLPFRGGGVRAGHGSERVAAGEIVAHPDGCPHVKFCGCGVARYIFGQVDGAMRRLWLAREWLRFPRASPAPGMVAANSGHVFAIEQVLSDGLVVAYDPNSGGHATRRHVVSLRGYTVVDPHRGG